MKQRPGELASKAAIESRVLELVGPAGAGKTTLRRALCRHDPHMREGPHLGRVRQIRLTLHHAVSLLPTFLRSYRSDRWFNRAELRALAYLAGWHEILGRDAGRDPRVTLLDHGPVFRLALLREFGPSLTRSPAFERHWYEMLERWAATLDRIVWLDAADEVLIERIRHRAQAHGIKEGTDDEMRAFLQRYRSRLENVLEQLAHAGGPKTLHFDTARQSSDEIAARVRAVLWQDAPSGPPPRSAAGRDPHTAPGT